MGSGGGPERKNGGKVVCGQAVMESAPILACQRWLRTNRCPVCCGLREAVAADPGTMPSSSVCSVSHTCLPGPVHTHTPSLCPRQSHPISTSSMWSSRCGNSVLLQCRQRCVRAPPSYPPPAPPPDTGRLLCFPYSVITHPNRSSTDSCTTRWPSYSPVLSRTPAPTTRN